MNALRRGQTPTERLNLHFHFDVQCVAIGSCDGRMYDAVGHPALRRTNRLMGKHDPRDLTAVAKWLYRRYRKVPKPEWGLAGGNERGRWLGDAVGIFDAITEGRQGEADVAGSVHAKPPSTDGLVTVSPSTTANARREKVGPPVRPTVHLMAVAQSSDKAQGVLRDAFGHPEKHCTTPSVSCKGCGRTAKSLCVDCLTDAAGERMRGIAVGVLRGMIKDHGPITAAFIGSAAKRLSSQWQAYLKQTTPTEGQDDG